MALAKNLQKKKLNFKFPKLSKKMIIAGVLVSFVVIIFGILSLSRLSIFKQQKMEVKFQTGDQPLPEKIPLWVNADGGLFLRETADAKGKIMIVIPNGTQLSAEETKEDWYKVSYMNKTGWVNKNYVLTQAPPEDSSKGWNTFVNKNFGYSVRYPKEWVAQDYGANPATSSDSYVAFGTQLSATLDPSKVPPILIRVTKQTKDQAEANYKSAQNPLLEAATVSGLTADKITYTSSSSGVQMTAFIVPKGASVYVIEETGGFSDELLKIVASLNLG